MKRIVEVVVGCQVVMSLFQQWMIPSVKNSLIPFSVSVLHIIMIFPNDTSLRFSNLKYEIGLVRKENSILYLENLSNK